MPWNLKIYTVVINRFSSKSYDLNLFKLILHTTKLYINSMQRHSGFFNYKDWTGLFLNATKPDFVTVISPPSSSVFLFLFYPAAHWHFLWVSTLHRIRFLIQALAHRHLLHLLYLPLMYLNAFVLLRCGRLLSPGVDSPTLLWQCDNIPQDRC